MIVRNVFFTLAFFLCVASAFAIEWQEVDVPKSNFIDYIAQKGDDVILCGPGIKVSHDGGKTFKYSNKIDQMVLDGVNVETNCFLNYYAYITDSGNYFVYTDFGHFLISTNRGESWNVIDIDLSLWSPKFYEDDYGLYLVHRKGIYYSTDDGISWKIGFKIDPNYLYYTFESNYYQDNKISLHKTIYSDLGQEVYTFDTKLKSLDSTHSHKKVRSSYSYNNNIYDYSYSGHPDVYDTLFKKGTNGKWEYELDLLENIMTQLEPNAETIEIDEIIAENGLFWITYDYTLNQKKSTSYAFSKDNGKTFNKYKNDENSPVFWNYIRIFDNEFYTWYKGIMRYDWENYKFEYVNYEFPLTTIYRNINGNEAAISYKTNYGDLLTWSKIDGEWDKGDVYDYDSYYISMSGAVLITEVIDNEIIVRIKYKDQLDTILNKYVFSKSIRNFEDGSTLFLLRSTETSLHKILLLKNGTITTIKDEVEEFLDYDFEDESFTYIQGGNDVTLIRGKTYSEKLDSLKLDIFYKNIQVTNFASQKNKLIFTSNDTLYTSIDSGKTLASFPNNHQLANKTTVTIFNNYFYATSSLGLFRSSDGITWENIIEDYFDSQVWVYNYEFDLEGHIIAYTTMGTFKSTDPVSVKENDQNTINPNISINIYPNPSSDILNFDFNGQVEKTAVVDLNGNIISCPQTFNSLDISELSSGAYFLKVTSNGKIYYRQFVKAE